MSTYSWLCVLVGALFLALSVSIPILFVFILKGEPDREEMLTAPPSRESPREIARASPSGRVRAMPKAAPSSPWNSGPWPNQGTAHVLQRESSGPKKPESTRAIIQPWRLRYASWIPPPRIGTSRAVFVAPPLTRVARFFLSALNE